MKQRDPDASCATCPFFADANGEFSQTVGHIGAARGAFDITPSAHMGYGECRREAPCKKQEVEDQGIFGIETTTTMASYPEVFTTHWCAHHPDIHDTWWKRLKRWVRRKPTPQEPAPPDDDLTSTVMMMEWKLSRLDADIQGHYADLSNRLRVLEPSHNFVHANPMPKPYEECDVEEAAARWEKASAAVTAGAPFHVRNVNGQWGAGYAGESGGVLTDHLLKLPPGEYEVYVDGCLTVAFTQADTAPEGEDDAEGWR